MKMFVPFGSQFFLTYIVLNPLRYFILRNAYEAAASFVVLVTYAYYDSVSESLIYCLRITLHILECFLFTITLIYSRLTKPFHLLLTNNIDPVPNYNQNRRIN